MRVDLRAAEETLAELPLPFDRPVNLPESAIARSTAGEAPCASTSMMTRCARRADSGNLPQGAGGIEERRERLGELEDGGRRPPEREPLLR